MSCICHRFVGRTGEGLLDAGLEHLVALDDRLNIRDRSEGRISRAVIQ